MCEIKFSKKNSKTHGLIGLHTYKTTAKVLSISVPILSELVIDSK